MNIEIQLLREAEGDVEFDAKSRTITITPFFVKPRELKTIMHVEVQGKSGNTRKSMVQISGSNGRVMAQGVDVDGVESLFDTGAVAEDDDTLAGGDPKTSTSAAAGPGGGAE